MPYEFLEHTADIGIRAWGNTLEETFVEGAKALFDIMVDIKNVEPKTSVYIECDAPNVPTLFVEWLNQLLTRADIARFVFGDFKIIEISTSDHTPYHLKAIAYGEAIDPQKHNIKTEAKAATYFGLNYSQEGGIHLLECVIDV